jgi:TonB family protein
MSAASRAARPPAAVMALVIGSVAPSALSAQSIMGRVVDAATGQPLRSAAVGVQVPGDSVVTTLTARDGVFALRLPASGTYVVRVQASLAPPVLSDSIEVGTDSTVQREFRVAMPADPVFYEYQVDRPLLRLPGGAVPRYPQALRERGVYEGSATLRYLVDTLGRIDATNIVVVKQTHPEFAAHALATARAQRFQPAERDGRKVRVLVELPFVFTIQSSTVRVRTRTVERRVGLPSPNAP